MGVFPGTVEGQCGEHTGAGQVGAPQSHQCLSPYKTVCWDDVALAELFLKCCITHDSPEKQNQ